MKKWLSFIVLFAVLFTCALASGEEDVWLFDDDYYVLKSYTGTEADVVVPADIREGTVDVLGTHAFNHNETVVSLTLPETLLQLQSEAISWCSQLRSVSLPQSLIVINDRNFWQCNALNEITIPAGVRSIGETSFYACAALQSVTFQGVCPAIGKDCFVSLADNAVIYVPDDQLDAYQAALQAAGCTASVQPSGVNAVVVDNNGYVESEFDFDASTGTITAYNGYATYLSIPETIGGAAVKAIGANAFYGHYYLAVLELPEGLETIGENAFYNCQTLGCVSFPSTLKTIEARAFYNSYFADSIDLKQVVAIGEEAFRYARLSGTVTLPEGLVAIGDGAFADNHSLEELYLPASLESIGKEAFSGDSSLAYVYMDGLTPPALGENAFADCASLTDIDLNEHCTKQQMLDMQAVVDGMGLTACRVWRNQNTLTATPSDHLDVYENGLMVAYTGQETHIRPFGSYMLNGEAITVTGLADGVFKGNTTLAYFAVNHNDEPFTIGDEAFMNSAIQGVDLFDSVTSIGARAFANCTNLEELTIPDSVTSIGEGAFNGLTGLKKLTILCDASLLPAGSFAGLSNLSEVTLAQGKIPARLFENSSVSSLTLGEGVTEIGESAFAGTLLTSVDLTHVSVVGAYAFARTALTHLVVPASASIDATAVDGIDVDLRIAADATDEQVAAMSAVLNRPWYDPLLRDGETSQFVKMPFTPTPAEFFDFDPETGLIEAYTGADVDVVVPREIGGVTVVGFKNYNAFASCQDYTDTDMDTNVTDWVHLRTLVLPETIASLPDSLLAYCQQLETFICYAPLESTGRSTFSLCRSLDTVIFVNGVLMIDNYAFDGAGTLSRTYFGSSLVSIGEQAFNNTKQTFFYADAEEIRYGAFSYCDGLTSLHFSAKVKSFAENSVVSCGALTEVCFDGCDLTGSPSGILFKPAAALTVHVPADWDEANLTRAQNCVSWSDASTDVTVVADGCTHTPPERPDIPSLLPHLTLDDGMNASAAESTAASVTLAAAESGESSAAPAAAAGDSILDAYTGIWYCESITVEGTTLSLSDIGYEMTLTISADGQAQVVSGDETESYTCTMADNLLIMEDLSGMLEGEKLVMSDGSTDMVFSREQPSPAFVPAPVNESATLDDFLGQWTIAYVSVEGMAMSAEAAGLETDCLTIYGSTCDMTYLGSALDQLPCTMEGYTLSVEIMDGTAPTTLHTDGMLSLTCGDLTLWYKHTGDLPAETAQPSHAASDSPVVTEHKYVMTDAEVNGYNLSAQQLGGYEYSILFHEDGTADFVMSGTAVPGLPWHSNETGIAVDYYGQTVQVVITESGLDMDYFGAMTLHLVLE
ncbi:MAG: leucine-rich repeat protein [Clostridia bacterium]|nr:leucine-rich repeat protein [Clostridia bacterium]